VVSQNFLALQRGGVNATIQREKLFKNAVWWLLRFPGAPPFMNVSLQIQDAPRQLAVGQELELRFTVRHSGEIPATGVILTVALPPEIGLVAATSENSDIVVEERNIICFLPDLGGVRGVEAALVVRALAPGPVEIAASVSQNEPEAILSDNALSLTLEISE
jgi:uncharacterized repeat protein (TIGR01451 family)